MKTKYTQKTPLTTLLLVCLVIVLSAAKCQKDNDPPEDKLPPITTEGKNTFGCKINGEVWVPWVHPFSILSKLSSGYDNGHFMVVATRRTEDDDQIMSINIFEKFYNEGEYSISPVENSRAIYTDSELLCEYMTDTIYNGVLNILRRDTMAGIISGTFSFTGYFSDDNDDCLEYIEVTDGRFDVFYK